MLTNFSSDDEEHIWYWKYLDNQMYIDVGEEIRFRVLSIEFSDNDSMTSADPATKLVMQMADLRPAMRVLVSSICLLLAHASVASFSVHRDPSQRMASA